MSGTTPELLGLACEVADCVTVVAPRGWKSVALQLERKSDQLRVTQVDAKLEGAPAPKPDLGMDDAARLGGISAALTDALHLLHHQGVDWQGGRATITRPSADRRVLSLFNDDGRPAFSVNVPGEYVQALFLSDAFLDALAEAEPRIAKRQEELSQRVAGSTRWAFSQPERQLTFEFADRPKLVVPAQFLGTWSPEDESWLWGWANTSVDEKCTNLVEAALKPDHQEPGMAVFWREKFPCEPDFAARVAMLAADRMGATGVYRGAVGGASAYLALMG